MPNIVIVGNGFKDFSDKESVWAIDDYLQDAQKDISVILGQGLVDKDFEAIKNKVSCDVINISQIAKEMTHQQNDRNVLVYNLRNTGKEHFQANIYIRGENDLLQDHITGIHVSGMILVEAARQLFIASLMNDGYLDDRFVLNNIYTSFLSYVFPTEIIMDLSYRYVKSTKNEKRVIAKVQALQNNTVCAEFEIKSTLIPNKLAAMGEKLSANQFKKNLRN